MINFTSPAKSRATIVCSQAELEALIEKASEQAINTALIGVGVKPDPELIKTSPRFSDYLLKFWCYEISPYIKELIERGETPPGKTRFYNNFCTMRKYSHFFGDITLYELTAKDVNIFLAKIQEFGAISNAHLHTINKAIKQALRFAYRQGLIAKDIRDGIRKTSPKNDEKSIFTTAELTSLFQNKANPFESDKMFLFNKLLIETGCRTGEIQALQVRDLVKTEKGYILLVSKNWSRTGELKCTKTERKDKILLPPETAELLLDHIKQNEWTGLDAFIFQSKDMNRPTSYGTIRRNFVKTMKRQGIERRGLTLHSYRHTYATLLRDAGFNGYELLRLTRHDSPAMLKTYSNHDTEASLKKELENDVKALAVVGMYTVRKTA